MEQEKVKKQKLWREPQRKRGEIIWSILEVIAHIPEAVVHGFIDQGSIATHLDKPVAADLTKHLRDLCQSKYIEAKSVNGTVCVRLTTKGKIKNLESPSNGIIDGKIRALSYDIPEKHKIQRQKFCRSLKRIGYIQLQKSLWVCRYSKADQIDILIDELGIEEFVAYFIIDKSNIPEHLENLGKT